MIDQMVSSIKKAFGDFVFPFNRNKQINFFQFSFLKFSFIISYFSIYLESVPNIELIHDVFFLSFVIRNSILKFWKKSFSNRWGKLIDDLAVNIIMENDYE